jgi:hypothetical protein
MTTGITAQAHVVGMVRGREIDRVARVFLDGDALVLAWQDATPWRLLLEGIDGMASGPSSLTVYLASNDVLELSNDTQLRPLAAQLLDRACAMPEVMRGLKSPGRSQGKAEGAHDRWFAPLLAVRRLVEGVSDPVRQVQLLDAGTLTLELERAIGEIAAIAAPGGAAEQRAVEAVLEEAAAPLFLAVAMMGIAGDAVRGGALDTRMADWRQWVHTVRGVFAAADDAWTAMADAIA